MTHHETAASFRWANASRITDQLFIGGDLDSRRLTKALRQLDELDAVGITDILDVRIEWGDQNLVAEAKPHLRYHWLGVDDAGQEMPDEWFEAGTGLITANGGNGDGGDSGGGGGGRIAIYHNGLAAFDMNHLQVAGGFGCQTGGLGTIYLGDSVANVTPFLLAVTPADTVPHGVSAVEAIFDTAINASSFTPADVVVTTPSGVLPAAQITVTELTPQVFRISFPMQMADGDYSIQIGPDLANTFGTPMATAQAGAFTISIPRTLTYTAGTSTLSVAWPTTTGLKYMLQASPDLTTWTDVGGWVTGNGAPLQATFATTSAPQQFFRLKVGN